MDSRLPVLSKAILLIITHPLVLTVLPYLASLPISPDSLAGQVGMGQSEYQWFEGSHPLARLADQGQRP
jgi:hypothetical protein